MLLAKYQLDGRGALYEQLARVLKRAIVEGHFHPGERLPAGHDTLSIEPIRRSRWQRTGHLIHEVNQCFI
ncbi:MAG: hypothetical protein ACRETZ_07035 [Steroidobacteraceae bacterium]